MKIFNYIYIITNNINGKIYIGKHSTDNLNDGYMGSGILISKAIKKYGIENFSKQYLVFCDTEDKLNWFERFYIRKYKARELGYNLTDGGDGGNGSANKGKKRTLEQRQKISLNTSGEKNPFYRRHHLEETKQIISKKLKNNVPWNKGKTDIYSRETINKMSISKIGNHYPKLSEAKKGCTPANKGIKVEKFKWITPLGEIKEMDINNVKRWHPDWTLLN